MKYKNKFKPRMISERPSMQRGMALLSIVLVMMVIIGIGSMTASKMNILETKMVFNMQEKQRSLVAADSAATYGWEQIKIGVDIKKVIDNAAQPGYYVLGNKIPNTTKSDVDWNALGNVASWPWENATKRFEIPVQLGGVGNPMKLSSTPQFIVGMHNPIFRKGSTNHYCIPMSVIGASKGATAQTRTLIEVKAIPSGLCYYDKIK